MGFVTIEAKNVVLIVGDAVRYDYSCGLLSELGQTHKSVSASLHTAPSFASIFTGQHVPNHNSGTFHTAIDDSIDKISDLDNHAVASPDSGMNKQIQWLLNDIKTQSLGDIQPPFIWTVRTGGGHSPYNYYNYEEFKADIPAGEYFDKAAGDPELMRSDYRSALKKEVDYIKSVQAKLEQRGILEETLIIYTSDHGELLGEYGMIGHNHIACPELVYVPTTLIHPEIDPSVSDELLSNVDIFPTIVDALGYSQIGSLDGMSAFSEAEREYGYNYYLTWFYQTPWFNKLDRVVHSVWESQGGHSKTETTRIEGSLIWLAILLKSPKGKHIRRTKSHKQSLEMFQPGWRKFATPNFDIPKAQSIIDGIKKGSDNPVVFNETLDSDQKEQLEDLGYL